MPSMFGKDNKKKELIANLGAIYEKIEREHNISPGDFPNLKKMQVMTFEYPEYSSVFMFNYLKGIVFTELN